MCTSLSASDIFLSLLAILFPPLSVWVKCGICSIDSLINILLCTLGYIPGLLHAWYIIAKFPEPALAHQDYEALPQDPERARVTYVYVQGGPGPAGRQQRGAVKLSAENAAGYGTTATMTPTAPIVRQEENGTWAGGEGSAGGSGTQAPPPPYEQAVGDHKVQTRD